VSESEPVSVSVSVPVSVPVSESESEKCTRTGSPSSDARNLTPVKPQGLAPASAREGLLRGVFSKSFSATISKRTSAVASQKGGILSPRKGACVCAYLHACMPSAHIHQKPYMYTCNAVVVHTRTPKTELCTHVTHTHTPKTVYVHT
jgi:hypothetical protein